MTESLPINQGPVLSDSLNQAFLNETPIYNSSTFILEQDG